MSELIRDLALFGLVIGSGALPIAARLRNGSPLERLSIGAGATLILFYALAASIYLAGVSWSWLWALPVMGAGAVWFERRGIAALRADATVRAGVIGWLLLSAWCLGLHAFIFNYCGGGWAGDWYEHYERASFFLQHWALDHRFLGFNLLPARPPFANLATAGFMGMGGGGFVHYQIHTTLLSTLVFFPLAALTQRRGANLRALSLLGLLLMLNPLLVHNATFTWTKLPAAFFVLLSVVLLLRSLETKSGHGWAGVMLGAGLVAHYSVAPWILALGAAWLWCGRMNWRDAAFRREAIGGALAAAVLIGSWLGWAAYHYGHQVVEATSTVGLAPAATAGGHLLIALANIGHTLVPDWNSPILVTLLQQSDLWARWRDFWFCLYQQNLPIACGLGSLVVLLWLLAPRRFGAIPLFWKILVPLAVIGVVSHTWPVDLGLTHICLQPLVLLALAWLAVEAEHLPRWLGVVWAVGLAADFLLGIALHFGVQSLALERWSHPELNDVQLTGRSASTMMMNLRGKISLQQPFLYDLLTGKLALMLLLVAGVLALALVRWQQSRKFVSPRVAAAP